MKRMWLHGLEQLRSAIPIVVVAGMAAFTWWLVQSTPKGSSTRPAAQASSSPDYELEQARIERFDAQGQLVAVLDGRAMRHYAQGDRMEIDAVQLSARDASGRRLQALARQGLADGVTEVVTLKGGAHVVAMAASGATGLTASPLTFDGEVLRIDTKAQKLSSDQPVRLVHQAGVVRGGSMVHNRATGITELNQRVTGYYDAPPRR